MSEVYFTRQPDGAAYTLRFAYSPELVALIKTTVPHYARRWRPDDKAWVVHVEFAQILANALTRQGHTVVEVDGPGPHRTDTDDADAGAWARLLFARVGPQRADAVYRALSKCLHPDVGGDTELQRELNAAHTLAEARERRRQREEASKASAR